MYKLLFVLLIASVAFSAGNSETVCQDTPGGPQPVQSPAPVYSESDFADFDESYTSPVMYTAARPSEGTSEWPDVDWNNDILVFGGRTGSGQDFDVDENNDDIYAIFDTNHSGGSVTDSAMVYRSQDGGVTWNFWRTSNNPSGTMNDPQIRVVKDASSQTWVCMFFLRDDVLYMRRMTPDQSASAWEIVANDVANYDVDGEVGTGGWVYVTYVPLGTTNVRFARNSLTGSGWQDDIRLFFETQVTPYPTIAAGADGTVSVFFTDARFTANSELRIKRSFNYGSTWEGSEQISNNGSGADLKWNDMAYSHGTTETGWVFTTFDFGSYDNIAYYYSQDGGINWTYGAVIEPFGGDENMPNCRARKSTGSLTLAYNSDPGDSTMFTWASAVNPTNFTTSVRVNDHNATGYWPPTAGWNGSSSAVLYTSFSMGYNGYFDWFGNTPVEEETNLDIPTGSAIAISPNPVTDFAAISFSTLQPGNVSLSVYDSAGRLIDTLVDESLAGGEHSINWSATDELTPGVYFCVMNAGGETHNQRIVLIR